MAPGGFSIRAYAARMRDKAAELAPFASSAEDLPPMEVRHFRWWEDELAAVKASQATAAVAETQEEEAQEVGEEEEEEPTSGKGRPPKKRSISDLIAAAPPVDPPSSSPASRAGEDDELLGEIARRAKEKKRKRRVEAEAAAAVPAAVTTTAPAEPASWAGATREGEAASAARKEALDKTHLQDGLDIPELSEEPEAEQSISNFQKHGADKQKYIESKKAKVDKQRDLEKRIPLQSILKKYTKHTTVKMVKEKHGNPKRTGVIELCRKSVKRVKFSEANDVHGSDKQSSKMPQLENLCKLFSDAMTSSSSTDMSSEEDRHTAAESSSSDKPEKASTKAQEENGSTNQENFCKISNSGSSDLFDLNMALPESTEFGPYTSNSEVLSVEHTQHGTFSVDEQSLDNGKENQKHATDSEDIRATEKSQAPPSLTVHDSVQLQQSLWSMTLQHGGSQISTGGEHPSCQSAGFDISHRGIQQERWPAGAQTFRLMGKDLTLSASRVSSLAENSQRHRGPPSNDNLNAKMVLGLPQQGKPFLSLQAPGTPIVPVNTTSRVNGPANPVGKIQAQSGYVSQPLPAANFFGDPSPYEPRFWNSANLASHRNVLLGYPPVPNNGREAVRQNSRAPWLCPPDNSTRMELPSEPSDPARMQRMTQSSDYHAVLPEPYGFYSASSSVPSHSNWSFTLSNPARIAQGVPGSRVSSALPHSRYAEIGVAGAVPEYSSASSSSRQVLRSGPVRLSAGATHTLMPRESTVDDNAAPLHSFVSFSSSGRNVSAPRGKEADFRKS